MWDQKINQKIACLAVFACVTLVLALPALANTEWLGHQEPVQWQAANEQPVMHVMSGRYGSLQSSRDFINSEIKNDQGETLGTVKEILLDNTQSLVCYAVIAAPNGILHPVPWAAFTVSPDRITLNIDRARFMLSPSIRMDELGKLYAPDYRDSVHNYFSEIIYNAQEKNTSAVSEEMMETPGTAQSLDLYKGSVILGRTVSNSEGKDIASLRNIVFDTREGNLAYGVVAFGGILGLGQKEAAVPWTSLRIETTPGIVKLDASRETLEACVIPGNNLERLNERQFASRVYENFGTQPYWEVLGFVPPEEKPAAMTARQPDSKLFNPGTITTIEGVIQEVGTYTPENDAAVLKLIVKTEKNEMFIVHGGPIDYAAQKDLNFKPDMHITVTGSKTMVDKETVIIATQIKAGDKVLLLRDNKGEPKWNKVETEKMKPHSDSRLFSPAHSF